MSFLYSQKFLVCLYHGITNTELPKTLRSVQCHRKRILSANCESRCHLDKLGITAKCISVKCAILSHLQMCQCLLILLAISFSDYPQIESFTMSTTHLLLFAVDNWFHSDTVWSVFEISGNLSFCLLRSLTSFDGKVTTRIGIGFGTRLRTMNFSSSYLHFA